MAGAHALAEVKVKISFFYSYPRPWHDSEMCILGLWTLCEKGSWFQIGIALFFVEFGLHIGKEL